MERSPEGRAWVLTLDLAWGRHDEKNLDATVRPEKKNSERKKKGWGTGRVNIEWDEGGDLKKSDSAGKTGPCLRSKPNVGWGKAYQKEKKKGGKEREIDRCDKPTLEGEASRNL